MNGLQKVGLFSPSFHSRYRATDKLAASFPMKATKQIKASPGEGTKYLPNETYPRVPPLSYLFYLYSNADPFRVSWFRI